MKIIFSQDFTLVSSNISDSSYPNYNPATAYSVGTDVYVPSNYGEYKCLVANTGIDPLTSVYDPDKNPSGKWQFLGTTNKYKMFDKYLYSQSLKNGKIIVQLVSSGAQAVFLGNIVAKTINIKVVNPTTLEVYEEYTETMTRKITGWVDYLYGDWRTNRRNSFIYNRTTGTRNVAFIIEIDNGTSDAKCGIFLCGKIKDIGYTKWDAKFGSLDYSTFVTDTSIGDVYFSKGKYAKIGTVDIFVDTTLCTTAQKILEDAQGQTIVFVPGYDNDLAIYGFIKKFEQLLKGPKETLITLDMQGLI